MGGTTMFRLLLALSLVVQLVHGQDVKKILTVGDSWAEYSGNSFSKYCPCALQIQRGIGGTTAVQWAAGASREQETSFPNALTAAGTMNANDIVILSVGGNDWIG